MRRRSPAVDCCLDAPVAQRQLPLDRAVGTVVPSRPVDDDGEGAIGCFEGYRRCYRGNHPLGPILRHGGRDLVTSSAAMNPLSRRRHLSAQEGVSIRLAG